MSTDTPTPYDDPHFESDQHAADTGRLIGYLKGMNVDVTGEMDDINYTPVVRVDIEGQPPIWVRVQPPIS